MTSSPQDGRPLHRWRRGLLAAGFALAVGLLFRATDQRRQKGVPPAPPPPPATAMPADASLGLPPTKAPPRLLILLPATPAPGQRDLMADLRAAAADRLIVRAGDADVARAMGFPVLPGFVLYDGTGQELRRFSGPHALADLATQLQPLGITIDASGREGCRD